MKFYKLVTIVKEGNNLKRKSLYNEDLRDHSVEYTPLQEVKTKDGSPLFVVTDLELALRLKCVVNREVWECEGKEVCSDLVFPALPKFLRVQPYSVFVESVTLIKFIC